MEGKYDVVSAWCKCNKIVLAMTTEEYQRSGKPEIDSFFDMGYKIGRTTKAAARELFGCECEGKTSSTGDDALHIGSVGGSLPSDEAKTWLKKYIDKKLMKNHPEYRTTENMVKYVFGKGWKMAKEQ